MFKSLVAPLKFGFLNGLKQSKRRRLQSQSVGFGDSLEVRLLLTGPQLVNPIANNGQILTDVVSDHGGDLTVNVDVIGGGGYELTIEAMEGETVVIDLTMYVAPNTSENVTLQIVESPDQFFGGVEMSNSVTLNVPGVVVLATELDWIAGTLSGAVDLTNSQGTTELLYRTVGDSEWDLVGDISSVDGSFLFQFDVADGETDFEFAVEHSFMATSVMSGSVTIIDMTAFDPTLDPVLESEVDDLFAEGDV